MLHIFPRAFQDNYQLLCCCRHGYLESLPAREYLPIFWQQDELALLQGTELAGKADADRYDLHATGSEVCKSLECLHKDLTLIHLYLRLSVSALLTSKNNLNAKLPAAEKLQQQAMHDWCV